MDPLAIVAQIFGPEDVPIVILIVIGACEPIFNDLVTVERPAVEFIDILARVRGCPLAGKAACDSYARTSAASKGKSGVFRVYPCFAVFGHAYAYVFFVFVARFDAIHAGLLNRNSGLWRVDFYVCVVLVKCQCANDQRSLRQAKRHAAVFKAGNVQVAVLVKPQKRLAV